MVNKKIIITKIHQFILTIIKSKHASICPQGKYVFVSGKRGFCTYTLSTGKWKLFNNMLHVREIDPKYLSKT